MKTNSIWCVYDELNRMVGARNSRDEAKTLVAKLIKEHNDCHTFTVHQTKRNITK